MRLAVSALVCLAMLCIVGTALANIPDSQQSSFDERLARSPQNCHPSNPLFEYVYTGTLRNTAGQPVSGWPANDIELEIFAGLPGDDPCINPVTINPIGPSDANGLVVWNRTSLNNAGVPNSGGACQAVGSVVIRIVSLAETFKVLDRVTSTDSNGDGAIGLADLGSLQVAVFNNPPCDVRDCLYWGDLNLDGSIDGLPDLGFLQTQAFSNSACP